MAEVVEFGKMMTQKEVFSVKGGSREIEFDPVSGEVVNKYGRIFAAQADFLQGWLGVELEEKIIFTGIEVGRAGVAFVCQARGETASLVGNVVWDDKDVFTTGFSDFGFGGMAGSSSLFSEMGGDGKLRIGYIFPPVDNPASLIRLAGNYRSRGLILGTDLARRKVIFETQGANKIESLGIFSVYPERADWIKRTINEAGRLTLRGQSVEFVDIFPMRREVMLSFAGGDYLRQGIIPVFISSRDHNPESLGGIENMADRWLMDGDTYNILMRQKRGFDVFKLVRGGEVCVFPKGSLMRGEPQVLRLGLT